MDACGAPGPSAPAIATAATATAATAATANVATAAATAASATPADSKDSVSLFDLASGTAPAPLATADSATHLQWLTRDAAARLAIRNHLPLAKCAHFGQHRTAHALYDAVDARYSSPATAALGRLLLPYLFPELSAFATVEDLVSHLSFIDSYRVQYAAHQLNLWLRVSLPETSPTLGWTGEVGDASVFRVWGSRFFVCDTSADKLSARAIPCIFLGFVPYAPGWQFYHPTSRRVLPSLDVTFDESVHFTIYSPTALPLSLPRLSSLLQMDITTAFLNGIIQEELYMLQPERLDDGSGKVCRLKKAIYGLKQAPRAWYHKLEETLLAGGFKKSECDHSLFLLQEKEQFLMLLVYVDYILLFSESAAMIECVEEMLEMHFKCSKMGDVKYYIGMHVERDLDKGVLRLHQRKYCEGLAEKYGLQDGGKPATPPTSGFTVEPCADEEAVGESDRKLFHSMVGALNYAANHTRPDIAFATSRIDSVVSRPSHEQLEAAKRLVRYVSATASVGLEYNAVRQRQQRGAADLGKGEMLLTCYTDASFNSVKADGTSIGGYLCLFGGGAVSWRNKKQNEVGLSSCETEYMALHHGVKEVVWLRRLLEEIGVCQRELTMMFCDNESAVKLAKNACLHGLTKHIRPKWHLVRRLLDKEVRLEIV
ncbi:unnamed protein product [Closterium sp. NIES-53]